MISGAALHGIVEGGGEGDDRRRSCRVLRTNANVRLVSLDSFQVLRRASRSEVGDDAIFPCVVALTILPRRQGDPGDPDRG